MISIVGSFSFAKLVMKSSAPRKKFVGDARYTSHDSLIHSSRQSMLSHTILTPISIRSAFFLHVRQMQLLRNLTFTFTLRNRDLGILGEHFVETNGKDKLFQINSFALILVLFKLQICCSQKW